MVYSDCDPPKALEVLLIACFIPRVKRSFELSELFAKRLERRLGIQPSVCCVVTLVLDD